MGLRTVYIRKEYEETFDSLPSKAAFIAWALEQVKRKREAREPKVTSPEDYA